MVRSIFARVQKERLPVSKHVVRIVPLQRVFFPDERELEENARELIASYFKEPLLQITNDLDIAGEMSSFSKRKLSGDEVGKEVDAGDDHIAKSLCTESKKGLLSVDDDKGSNEVVVDSVIKLEGDGNFLDSVLPTPCAAPALPPSFPRKFVYTVQFKARNHNVLEKQLVYSTVNKCMPTFARVDRNHYEVRDAYFLCMYVSCYAYYFRHRLVIMTLVLRIAGQ